MKGRKGLHNQKIREATEWAAQREVDERAAQRQFGEKADQREADERAAQREFGEKADQIEADERAKQKEIEKLNVETEKELAPERIEAESIPHSLCHKEKVLNARNPHFRLHRGKAVRFTCSILVYPGVKYSVLLLPLWKK